LNGEGVDPLVGIGRGAAERAVRCDGEPGGTGELGESEDSRIGIVSVVRDRTGDSLTAEGGEGDGILGEDRGVLDVGDGDLQLGGGGETAEVGGADGEGVGAGVGTAGFAEEFADGFHAQPGGTADDGIGNPVAKTETGADVRIRAVGGQ